MLKRIFFTPFPDAIFFLLKPAVCCFQFNNCSQGSLLVAGSAAAARSLKVREVAMVAMVEVGGYKHLVNNDQVK